jgi:hypothetical protein
MQWQKSMLVNLLLRNLQTVLQSFRQLAGHTSTPTAWAAGYGVPSIIQHWCTTQASQLQQAHSAPGVCLQRVHQWLCN